MVIPILVIFGSVFFGFALLYIAIKIWSRARNRRNSNVQRFSNSTNTSSSTIFDHDNEPDYYIESDIAETDSTQLISNEITSNESVSAVETQSSNQSTWDYNSYESSSDSSSSSSCSSSSDSSSSCSSGSSCSSSSSSDSAESLLNSLMRV